MITRRQFLKIATGGASLLLTGRFGLATKAYAMPIPGGTLDPRAIPKYQSPLTVPPAMPRAVPRKSRRGEDIDYYEISVRQFRQQVLPNGWPMTPVFGYGSPNAPETFSSPGFTIEARYRRPVRIKWSNELMDEHDHYLPHLLPVDPTLHWANPAGGPRGRDMRSDFTNQGVPGPYDGPVPIVPHLHGGHSSDDSDGYPTAWFLPNAGDIPESYARAGSMWGRFRGKFVRRTRGAEWSDGFSVYQVENDQRATTLWYHDHTLGMTRANVYAGLAGFYNLRGGAGDEVLDAATGLAAVLPGPAPATGDAPGLRYREIAIVIQDRAFNTDGSLFYPDTRAFFDGFTGPYIGDKTAPSDISPIWNPEFFGNTMLANGKTWPYLEVEPCRYRFRVLNGCGSRFLVLKLSDGTPLWQIGSDGGFLPAPVELSQLLIAPAERADIIIDFSGMVPGTEIILENHGPDEPLGHDAPMPADPETTGQVMLFRVGQLTAPDTSTPVDHLVLPAVPPLAPETTVRQVSLNEMMSMSVPDPADPTMMFGPVSAMLGTVNWGTVDPTTGLPVPTGVPMMWGDAVSERPRVGVTELWEIYNFTEDAHPIHIHQTMFEVVDREVFDPAFGLPGTLMPPEAWETGRKDTVVAYPGEVTRLRVHFDLRGQYVWHCHIIEHEDNEMMRPLLVI